MSKLRPARRRGGETERTASPAAPSARRPDRGDPAEHRFSRALWLAQILRQRIISGFYPPGERIREADLRAEFGFSNGPIRQALQTVVADGLAERAPWQSFRIKLLSRKQIVELFQVRSALLEYAAELAARNASPERRSRMPRRSSAASMKVSPGSKPAPGIRRSTASFRNGCWRPPATRCCGTSGTRPCSRP